MMTPYKALLIDCDGTIVPQAETIHQNTAQITLQQIHKEYNVAFNRDTFLSVWFAQLGKGMANFYKCYLKKTPTLSSQMINSSLSDSTQYFEDSYEDNYKTYLKSKTPAIRKGLADLIKEARKNGLKIAAVSNATQSVLEQTINACDLPPFDLILGKDTVERMGYKAKPDGGSYICACDTLGIKPEQSIGFEDTLSGYSSLVNANVGLRVYCHNDQNEDYETTMTATGLPLPHIVLTFGQCCKNAVTRYILNQHKNHGDPTPPRPS